MKAKLITIALLSTSLMFSCGEEKHEEHEQHEQHEHSEHEHHHSEAKHEEHNEHHASENVEGLTLNNGEKWVANAETHEGMGKIKNILEATNPTTLEGYHAIGKECDEQTAFIINNCTMTGEAHNQLHFVLHPILDDIEMLKNATTEEEGKKAYDSLSKNISDYFEHFKI